MTGDRSVALETVPAGDVGEQRVRRAELAISLVLRIGVSIAAALSLAGIVLVLVHHPGYASLHGGSYRVVTGPSYHFPHTLGQLSHALASGDGRGYIGLGLVVLIATPVLRVAVAVAVFLFQKDSRMTLVTFTVLVLLVGSFFIGGG